MNWDAFLKAAWEELDAFLTDPKNAEHHKTMCLKVSEAIFLGIAECEGRCHPLIKVEFLVKKCKAKAESKEANHGSQEVPSAPDQSDPDRRCG